MKLNTIKANPNNPRVLKDAKFKKLKKSIEDFPKMMELRPIIVDNDGMILGGNMRFRALQEIYGKSGEVPDEWVKRADDLTEDEKKQFIIKDNSSFGDWDWDLLANEWDAEELEDWGIDLTSETTDERPDLSMMIDVEYKLELTLNSEREQQEFYNEMKERGVECRCKNNSKF